MIFLLCNIITKEQFLSLFPFQFAQFSHSNKFRDFASFSSTVKKGLNIKTTQGNKFNYAENVNQFIFTLIY